MDVGLDHLQIMCVRDGKAIKDVLKKYGAIAIYDADGKHLELFRCARPAC